MIGIVIQKVYLEMEMGQFQDKVYHMEMYGQMNNLKLLNLQLLRELTIAKF